ncbi:hypothetical protein FOJ40_14545 [Salmonella enterica]|nr:hypothetical protein [Salmonella enterica]EBV5774014.1 hypothetical protein [Salmonella enterica subsp. enterica serovar Monophasic]EDN4944468.1 hypothetical protein [Salmonella enterica subsp. enterica serovar Norwich]EAT9153586.1 hypothetical protein [Salmonella enterica]EAU3553517.1 hypothetical protein [Salmonella enterica]
MSYVQRDITVEFTLSDGRTFDNGKGNILTVSGAKCFATVTVYGGTAGTQITLYIWGLSPAHMADLSYRGVWRPAQSTANEMRVRAGGRLIFEGDITDAYADYNQAPDIPLILTGQVSFNLRNQTATDFSAKGDVPVADIIRALASSAGLKFENQGVSRSLSNPHFSGNLVQQMLDAASAADINIDLGDAEKVTIWPKDKALDIPAVHISPDHGLIGYPVYTMTGLSATTTFCPDLFIGRRVHLESSLPNVTGDYQLTGVIHTITSRTVGGPWSSNCTGLVGTLIPAGSMAQDEAGYKYVSLSDATIGASGQVDVVFLNLSTGPVGCPAGTLNKIYKAIPGWSGVTNASAGVPGSDEETRADFENRRRNSVARNARNILEAIRGEILSTVENVVDVYVTHNPKKTEQKAGVSQYPLTPGSFYVGVYGGSPADIAAAIWRKAPPGIDMNGDTTFTVADKEYDPPYPEYVITWQTLKPVSLHVSVTLKKSDYLPSDITQQVQQSVLSAFNGTDGGLRARVASVVSAGRYYAGVYKTDPENIDILGLTVSRDGSSWTTAVTFGIDEIPVLDVSNIGVKLQEA